MLMPAPLAVRLDATGTRPCPITTAPSVIHELDRHLGRLDQRAGRVRRPSRAARTCTAMNTAEMAPASRHDRDAERAGSSWPATTRTAACACSGNTHGGDHHRAPDDEQHLDEGEERHRLERDQPHEHDRSGGGDADRDHRACASVSLTKPSLSGATRSNDQAIMLRVV